MGFLIGAILIACGVLVMKYRYTIYNFTGEWAWAATYLGGNGTITAIALIGMILIGVGVAYPFGVFDDMTKPPKMEIHNQN